MWSPNYWAWKGPLEKLWSKPSTQAGPPKDRCQHHRELFSILKDGDSAIWTICASAAFTLTVKIFLVQREPLVFQWVSSDWAPLNESGSLLFASVPPEHLLTLNLSFSGKCSNPSVMFASIGVPPVRPVCVGTPALDTVVQMQPHQRWAEGMDHLPHPDGDTTPFAALV